MSNVSRSERDADTAVTPYVIIRYEEDGNKVVAVCESSDGRRWYQIILVDGEPVF